MNNTITSKLTSSKQTSGKSNMQNLLNIPAQFEQIKNGKTGGERLIAIYNLISNFTGGGSSSGGNAANAAK